MGRIVFAGALFALLSGAALAAAPAADDAMTPINAFIAAVDKGDMAAAAATHVASPTIIDEFAPHHWSGPTAFADWGRDFGKDSAANNITDSKLTMHTPTRKTVEADHAYVVVPTDYSCKRAGKPETEHGTITYALDRTPDGWRIAAWAYSW